MRYFKYPFLVYFSVFLPRQNSLMSLYFSHTMGICLLKNAKKMKKKGKNRKKIGKKNIGKNIGKIYRKKYRKTEIVNNKHKNYTQKRYYNFKKGHFLGPFLI